MALVVGPLIAIAMLTPRLPPTADLVCAVVLSAGLLAAALLLTREPLSLRLLLPAVATGLTAAAWLTHGVSRASREIWPILAIPLATTLVAVAAATRERRPDFAAVVAVVVACALTLIGVTYTASNYALSWVEMSGPRTVASYPSMLGFGAPGPYAADLDEILRWIEREIPADDVVVFVPGEDPIHFALGRRPQLPMVLLDEANPFTPEEYARIAHDAGLRWVLVKGRQQIRTPRLPPETTRALTQGLVPVARVGAYQVYRRP